VLAGVVKEQLLQQQRRLQQQQLQLAMSMLRCHLTL
jgi:hypothetical protein